MTGSDDSTSGRFLTDSDYVLTVLINRMRPDLRGRETVCPKPVFVLGAGCSKQYDLPSFQELLIHLWEDQLHVSPGDATLEELRDGLEKYWRTLGPDSRQAVLKHYLGQAQGVHCPGYLRLARLAQQGSIQAIVNMNFDTLLEEALEAMDVTFRVSTTFRASDGGLMVYKPHGSIGRVDPLREPDGGKAGFETAIQTVRADIDHLVEEYGHELDLQELERLQESLTQVSVLDRRSAPNDLILDIAKGDLFADPQEQWCAQRLLSGSDVVVIGYSGVDAKIVAALQGFRRSQDPRNHKLFVINPEAPGPRLELAQEERGSRGLSILEEDGYFEGFMEELEKALKVPPGRQVRRLQRRRQQSGGTGRWEAGTREERIAFQNCAQFSRILWAALNVQGRTSVDWEEHGREVYARCKELV